MPFATSNVIQARGGDTWVMRGQWTGNIGDAPGTIKVPGAQLISADFYTNFASGAGGPSMVNGSGSGTLPITVTIDTYNANVTAGTFRIESK